MQNDNDLTDLPHDDPLIADAHGMASLVLVESLIHGLCENNLIRASDAVDVTERAASVQFDRATAATTGKAPLLRSHRLLEAIAVSLRTEIDRKPTPPSLVT